MENKKYKMEWSKEGIGFGIWVLEFVPLSSGSRLSRSSGGCGGRIWDL
ncbi:MAG: hypothetical protein HY769_03800 [Candidatus Stahlbacteria bacterium]|nr:hypothetical protein [Candidatus Stahlbacteria bacterium]